MQSGNLAALDGFPQGQRADAQPFGGLCKAEQAFLVLSLDVVFGNASLGAERTHSLATPAVAAAGEDAIAIQYIGDHGIVTDSGQLFDGLRCSRIRMVKGLPAFATTNVEFRMDTPFPVDDSLDPTGRRIEVDQHFWRVDFQWAMSPDGKELAVLKNSAVSDRAVPGTDAEASVHILNLETGQWSELVRVEGELQQVTYAPDMEALYIVTGGDGFMIDRVSRNGEIERLLRSTWWVYSPSASPDGSQLAFGVRTRTRTHDLYMLEDF